MAHQEQISKLRGSLLQLAHAGGPPALYDATVIAVDADQFTCDVELDGIELYEVRLRAIVSENSSIDVLPKVGSSVIVAKMADDDFFVIACDEISSWSAKIENTVVSVDSSGIEISRGDESLEKLLTDLVSAVLTIAAAKDAAALIRLKTRIKTLLK
jgi:hypothetical protein